MIVSTGEDKPGRVVGAVYNSSSSDVKLTINGARGAQTQVSVKQNSYTLLNESTDPAILSTTGAIPGSLSEVTISEDGTNQTAKVKVPVLDATLPEYKKYLPESSPLPAAHCMAGRAGTRPATGRTRPWHSLPHALISASVKGLKGVDWPHFPCISAVRGPDPCQLYA
jgi:hypothetical protein